MRFSYDNFFINNAVAQFAHRTNDVDKVRKLYTNLYNLVEAEYPNFSAACNQAGCNPMTVCLLIAICLVVIDFGVLTTMEREGERYLHIFQNANNDDFLQILRSDILAPILNRFILPDQFVYNMQDEIHRCHFDGVPVHSFRKFYRYILYPATLPMRDVYAQNNDHGHDAADVVDLVDDQPQPDQVQPNDTPVFDAALYRNDEEDFQSVLNQILTDFTPSPTTPERPPTPPTVMPQFPMLLGVGTCMLSYETNVPLANYCPRCVSFLCESCMGKLNAKCPFCLYFPMDATPRMFSAVDFFQGFVPPTPTPTNPPAKRSFETQTDPERLLKKTRTVTTVTEEVFIDYEDAVDGYQSDKTLTADDDDDTVLQDGEDTLVEEDSPPLF